MTYIFRVLAHIDQAAVTSADTNNTLRAIVKTVSISRDITRCPI